MGSTKPSPRDDPLFFEKAALVWQVIQKPARKSISDVLQMMDPTMEKSEAQKHKMKVSRLSKRLDIDQLLKAHSASSSIQVPANKQVETLEVVPAELPASARSPLNEAGNLATGPVDTAWVAGKKRSRPRGVESQPESTNDGTAESIKEKQTGSTGESSSKFTHGKTRWVELNRSLRKTERALRADGYKVARRTRHQVAVDRSNQIVDEEKMKEWSDEYVARFQEATACLVEARKVDPVNTSAKTICDRISAETNGRIQLSERSVRRAVQNGRAGQAPRKAGRPIGLSIPKTTATTTAQVAASTAANTALAAAARKQPGVSDNMEGPQPPDLVQKLYNRVA